jgi:hypothetical protein
MANIKVMLKVMFLLTISPLAARACEHLQNTTAGELVSYLDAIVPDQKNSVCVAFAINQLGNQRYGPAVPVLTRFLEFRWPADAQQKQRRFIIEHDGFTIYTAANSLEKIGSTALPVILGAIKSSTTPRGASEIAVEVWMQLQKHESAKAVARLKQEADTSKDRRVKSRLGWAAFIAATRWCSSSEQEQCTIAARTEYSAGGASLHASAKP